MVRSRRVGLELLLAVIFAVSACQSTGRTTTRPVGLSTLKVPVDGGGLYADLSAGGLYVMLAEKDFLLINVHVPYEADIEGTDLFSPYNEIEQHLDRLPTDSDAELVLYYRSGGMGAIAARTLVRQGYSNVWNLDGGMISWTKAGYPLLGA